MKPLQPHNVLVFIIATLLMTALPMLFSGKEGLNLGIVQLKYPTLSKFLNPPKQEDKDLSSILEGIDTSLVNSDSIPVDTFLRHKNNGKELGAPTDSSTKENTAGARHLEFGPNKDVLHPFFEKLRSAASKKRNVRIIHYGDSQIEGDRITAYFRQKLQSKFGGYGPGMIPAFNMYNTLSFEQSLSDNFKRHTLYGALSKEITYKGYGPMNSFARFTKYEPDSLLDDNEMQEAWIKISPSKRAYPNAREYSRVRMFYGHCRKRVEVLVYQDGNLIHEDTLISDATHHVFELKFESTPQELKFVFKGADSPDIYGFSLDGTYGIAVDNVAMRGSSGTFLGKNDQRMLSSQWANLDAELFIMQFGGNTMPYLKDEKGVQQYANHFKSQLFALKRLRPGACIIVLGPSDMSIKEEEVFVTYPLLPDLVNAMKKASFDAGAAYWDIYSAMGGSNSMPVWVEKNLAGPDYIHFTPGGAKYVAEMFYKAFIHEYQKFESGTEIEDNKTESGGEIKKKNDSIQ